MHILLKTLLRESMTAIPAGADNSSRDLETVLGLSFKFSRLILNPIFDKMSKEEQDYFSAHRSMEIFTSDGSDHDSPTGIMNFYISGFSPDMVKKALAGIKYHSKDLHIELGPFRGPEQSRMMKSQVVRIPIVRNHNTERNVEHSPEVQMSNDNAYLIFSHILDIPSDDLSDGTTVAAIDLLNKINYIMSRAEADDEFLYRYARAKSVEKGTGGVTMIDGGAGPDYILKRLQQVKDLCEYALKHDFRNISIS